jgi:hypothetical protein
MAVNLQLFSGERNIVPKEFQNMGDVTALHLFERQDFLRRFRKAGCLASIQPLEPSFYMANENGWTQGLLEKSIRSAHHRVRSHVPYLGGHP